MGDKHVQEKRGAWLVSLSLPMNGPWEARILPQFDEFVNNVDEGGATYFGLGPGLHEGAPKKQRSLVTYSESRKKNSTYRTTIFGKTPISLTNRKVFLFSFSSRLRRRPPLMQTPHVCHTSLNQRSSRWPCGNSDIKPVSFASDSFQGRRGREGRNLRTFYY